MDEQAISNHYGISGILDSILKGLENSGKNLEELVPEDLAPIDEFHTRGKESTIEIANLAQLEPQYNVLDVGCGLGGSARYIATKFGCSVTGVDLTDEYIDVANKLTEFVDLSDKVSFKQASALELPFTSESFDVVWTEHTQMNISNKVKFYSELGRVLKPNGRLVFQDIFGTNNPAHYPTPWAEHDSLSSLCTQEEAKDAIAKSNLVIEKWIDKSKLSIEFFKEMVKKTEGSSGPPPLAFHLLMGKTAKEKLMNQARNLVENRVTVIQGTATKN